MIPFVDVMKITSSTINYLLSEEWAVPTYGLLPKWKQTESHNDADSSCIPHLASPHNNWEYSILVSTVPGAGGQNELHLMDIANGIIHDLKKMGREGRRRRQRRRIRQL